MSALVEDVIVGAAWAALHDDPTVFDATMFLAALRAAGYAVVPVDATEAQTRAAAHLDWNAQIDPTWGEIYRVMIAAVDTPGGDGVE